VNHRVSRLLVNIRRTVRVTITIAIYVSFFAVAFVVATVASGAGSVPNAPLIAFTRVGLWFAVIGAIYGTVVALDRAAPQIPALRRVLRPFHSPTLRAAICGALGALAVWLVWSPDPQSFAFAWLPVGAALSALLGWFGWRWARYIDF
jgi:hypothetical protein